MTSLLLALALVVVLVFLALGTGPLLLRLRGRRWPHDILPGGAGTLAADHARVCGLTLIEAEDLLDWLEQNGYKQRGLQFEDDRTFAVQFQIDPEHPLVHASPMPHRALVQGPEVVKVRHGS